MAMKQFVSLFLIFFNICSSFRFVENTTDNIHQRIKCGDTFPEVCQHTRYRSYDGSCNNLRNPTWGLANTRYGRLIRPRYGDGENNYIFDFNITWLISKYVFSSIINNIDCGYNKTNIIKHALYIFKFKNNFFLLTCVFSIIIKN